MDADMSEFGDDGGRADAYDAAGRPLDPYAVAVRYHELRVLDGVGLDMWHTLNPDRQEIAVFIATGLVARLELGLTEPLGLARWLREIREYLSGQLLPVSEHQRDIDLLEELVAALRREGSLV